jgi:dienelactone hydrolase
MRFVILALALAICPGGLAAGAESPRISVPPFWGGLAPGPFAVGFRSLWQLDYSRAYNTVFDDKTTYATGKAPRPILVNMWYPAEESSDAPQIRHRGYLKIETEDPRLAKFAAKLAEYERSIVCKELTGKTETELSEPERRRLEAAWNTPTASRRGAPALDGRFPLVIYHSGAKSSYEDNAVLCEFLASHGYFVIGSAYVDATGRSLEVDGRDGSAREFEFLIGYARRMSNVDWNKIGLVGHSLGAQAILLYCAQDASPVDAVVSLDTTQDYDALGTLLWEDFTRPLLANCKNIKMPLLMIANGRAVFELADSLKYSERLYLTVAEQEHNDFIAQGIVRRQIDSEAKPQDVALRTRLEVARDGYEAVCRYTLEFFDVHLKSQGAKRNALLTKFSRNKVGGASPQVDYVPAGVSAPEAYRDDSGEPPTPRQVRPLLRARGVTPALGLLRTWHEKARAAPIFHADFGFALVDERLDKGLTADATAIFRLYSSFDRSFEHSFVRRGDAFRRHGLHQVARGYYHKALLVNPTDAEASVRLESLDEAKRD